MMQLLSIKRFAISILGRCAGLLLAFLLLIGCGSIDPVASTAGLPAPASEPSSQESPLLPTVDPGALLGQGQWAFIRDSVLYISHNHTEISVEDCSNNQCHVYYPTWSPGGQYLLYYIGSHDASVPPSIRVADLSGNVHTLTTEAAYLRPASWSPHGDQVVYFRNTGRYREEESPIIGSAEIFEVWVAEIEEEGAFGDAEMPSELQSEPLGELRGEVGFGIGCGGGGRSESANVYEREGGFAYGYLAGIMVWTADDILLFSNTCTSQTVGRFDLKQGIELEPYPFVARSLSLNPDRTAWVAIDQDGSLIQGTPGALTATTLVNSEPAELVFWGDVSNAYYYTTLRLESTADLVEEMARISDSIWFSPYFDFVESSIRRYLPASGEDTLVWSGDDYAYARLIEHNDGGLLFSSIEPSYQLYAALKNHQITAENLDELLPTVQVQMLPVGSQQPIQLLSSATTFSILR
jgi:hypothetical protein